MNPEISDLLERALAASSIRLLQLSAFSGFFASEAEV
jgi:hypothetical protein